jgi:hypothetical protein
MHQAEEPLPASVVKTLNAGTLAGYHPPMGFFMTVENRTTYAVTRLQVQVTTLETHRAEYYEINYFEPEGVSTGGTFITNQEHPDLHRINAGDRVSFRAPIAEKADSYEDWSTKYYYLVTKAWGYSTVRTKPPPPAAN